MELDDKNDGRETDLNAEVEAAFNQLYLDGFSKRPPFARLESEDFADHLTRTILSSSLQKCISKADALILLK